MTKEEIGFARLLCARTTPYAFDPANIHFSQEARTLLPKALDALEEANREIAQLKAHVCSLRCSDEAKSEDHEPGCPFYTGTYA